MYYTCWQDAAVNGLRHKREGEIGEGEQDEESTGWKGKDEEDEDESSNTKKGINEDEEDKEGEDEDGANENDEDG